MERRLERESRKSLSLALRTYLDKALYRTDRGIRFIVRNDPRYTNILGLLVRRGEVNTLIREMIAELHNMFSPLTACPISFCCMNTGFYYGIVITEKSCFVPFRRAPQSQIEYGQQFTDQSVIERELTRFDRVFDANFTGRDTKIEVLSGYITSLEHSLPNRIREER